MYVCMSTSYTHTSVYATSYRYTLRFDLFVSHTSVCACVCIRVWAFVNPYANTLSIDRPSEGWNIPGMGEKSRDESRLGTLRFTAPAHTTCHAITSNQTQLDTHTRTQKNKGVQKSAIRTSRHTAKKKKSLQHTHLKRIQSGYWNTHAHAARTPSLANTITHVHRCGRSILFSLTPIPFAQSPANRTDVTGQI